ncbi:equilibrative nucleoside transporter 3 [Hermetia illucens]|uniref:equilibrative nucleoside transporter 3 n=1 Tax=Hermetia illucens TaxID=343691 RepID=UPI0018CC02C4|nr:equilibrative nucleoside transporter 3 [Hermetia illucens]
MTTSINNRPLLEESETSENEEDFLDNSYTDTPGTSKNTVRTDSQAELVRFSQSVPADKFNFSYIIFYLLGVTTVLPWNFFLTAEEYWIFKFHNVTDNSTTVLTPIQRTITSDLTVAGSIPGTAFLIINALVSHLIPLKLRMIGSMVMMLLFFIVTTAFVEVETDSWQYGFYILTLTIAVFINSAAATLTGALMGLAGLFPSEYMTAVVSGQALSGIFSALSDIISLTFGAPPKTTAFVYFSIGTLTVIISLACYVIMSKTLFFRFYQNQAHKQIGSSTSLQDVNDTLQPNYREVIGKIYLYAFSLFYVFAVTLCVYPAVTVLVQSTNHGQGHPWNDVYFTPVVNYLLFNSGDYLGRILAGIIEKPRNKPHLIVLITTIRTAFIPILMMGYSTLHKFLPIVIHSDYVFILILAAFAVSNGYITNISLIMAPKMVMQHEKEMASSMMAACLGLGIAAGSLGSMALVGLF